MNLSLPGIENSSIWSKRKPNGITHILSSGKAVKWVLPDGLFFFRNWGNCGRSDKKKLLKFLFHGSIDEHVIQMAKPCVGATQVTKPVITEKYIYTLTKTLEKNGYHWILYKPQNEKAGWYWTCSLHCSTFWSNHWCVKKELTSNTALAAGRNKFLWSFVNKFDVTVSCMYR